MSPNSTTYNTPKSGRSSSDTSSHRSRGSNEGRRQSELGHHGAARRSAEHEPLLLPPSYEAIHTGGGLEARSHNEAVWEHDAGLAQIPEDTKSLTYLILLTFAMGGLQIAWSVELASISPFLLELGLSKSLLALVWIAGPLSGTLVQPFIGIKSDNCRSRLGRRRPFMIGGAVATSISLLALAWTEDIVGGFVAVFGVPPESHAARIFSQIWAILLVYILDIGINVLQAGIRAFIVDCAPTHQQESANATAGIITGFGGIIGYLCGQAKLTSTFSWLGDTHFKILCVVACIVMGLTMSVSCFSVKERDPRAFGPPSNQGSGLLSFFRICFLSIRSLPPQIKKVCIVQIFNWMGWFPFLFYTTTWIGTLYLEPFLVENPQMTDEEINDIFEEGTRRGTHAMFVFSITTLAASILLPLMISPTYAAPERTSGTPMTPVTPGTISHSMQNTDRDYFVRKAGSVRSNTSRFRSITSAVSIRVPWLTLRRAWILSHLAFAALIWSTLLTHTPRSATVVVAAIGIPWALTNWAPFALIAAEISKRDAIRRGARPPPQTRDGQLLASGEADDSADQAGIVLGIHNVAVSAPQVVATLLSSVIFKALQKPRGAISDDSVGWVLRLGGLCALGAAWCTRSVGEGDEDRQDPGPDR